MSRGSKKTYSEDEIRRLVDEALHHTPRGGYPELEKREGLKPGTLFDWVDQYGPPRQPLPFESLHFWIGTADQGEDAFWRYFGHAENYWDLEVEEIEAATGDVTGCGFCIDAGLKFLYDEDLMQLIWFDEPVPVRQIVDESTLESEASAEHIVRLCEERGIRTANAGFVYADPLLEIADPARLYNGLPYIGRFVSKEKRRKR